MGDEVKKEGQVDTPEGTALNQVALDLETGRDTSVAKDAISAMRESNSMIGRMVELIKGTYGKDKKDDKPAPQEDPAAEEVKDEPPGGVMESLQKMGEGKDYRKSMMHKCSKCWEKEAYNGTMPEAMTKAPTDEAIEVNAFLEQLVGVPEQVAALSQKVDDLGSHVGESLQGIHGIGTALDTSLETLLKGPVASDAAQTAAKPSPEDIERANKAGIELGLQALNKAPGVDVDPLTPQEQALAVKRDLVGLGGFNRLSGEEITAIRGELKK